jgi:AraC-like DNA-binding protein
MAPLKNESPTPIIRLGHPRAFAAFLRTVGTPTDRLFGELGLPVYCDDPAQFVPLRQAWALFDAAAQRVDPLVGWHVGQFYGDNKLSAGLLKKLENAPTLYQALQRFVHLISAEASHLELGILERPDDIVFFTRYSTIKDWPGYPVSQSYQLEAFVDLIRHYVGPDWVPRELGVEHPTVPAVAAEHFPSSRIRPNRQMGYVTVPRACLHVPARGYLGEEKDRDRVVLTEGFDFVDTLSALLEPHLLEGYPPQRVAASLMDTSVRTLARRLAAAGISYQTVVDRLRLQVAKEKLLDPDMRITDVANVVGFDDPANFTRMFRRVAGLTPRQYRQIAR